MSQILPQTEPQVSSNWTADEYKAAWKEVLDRHEMSGKATPSSTGRRLGSRAAAVYDAIFRSLNVPDDIARLMMFLAAMAEGQREFTAYRAELADAYFDETDTADKERARQSREQRFSRLIKVMDDWQRENDCWLIQYFPGYRIALGEKPVSEKGKFILPLLDLFSRVYTESRSTSAFQATRDAKLKRVTEAVITAEFHDIPAPGKKRKPRSMSRNDRVEREQKIILSRMSKLMQELTDQEQAAFMSALSEFIPLRTLEESGIKSPDADESLYKNSDTFAENKELAGNLGALVEDLENTAGGGGRALCSLTVSAAGLTDAQVAVDAFQSVGVQSIGITTDASGRDEYKVLAVQGLKRTVDDRIEQAEKAGCTKYIGRPIQPDVVSIFQQDDPAKNLDELQRLSFCYTRTSEEGRQGWLAVETGNITHDEHLRIKRALNAYFDADTGASGAMRWPGSLNNKYTPAFRVRVEQVRPGHVLQMADIEHILQMMPVEQVRPERQVTAGSTRQQTGAAYVPDWSRVAALHPDASRSQVDYYCALGAAQNGVSFDDAVSWLIECSPKAAEKRGQARSYAEMTVRNAYNSILPSGR